MGKKFISWTMQDIIDCVNGSLNNDFDCNILIEGKRGLGKSTLAFKICRRSQTSFNPNRDLLYSRDLVLKAVATRVEKSILADELVNVAYKRDFYEHGQKKLIKALNMYRDSFNLFIGCIPRFVDLDTDFQALCKLRLTVIRRGFALIHKQISSIYTKDPWDIKNNMKIEAKWSLSRTKKPKYSQLTTCIGYLIFGDLSPQQQVIYKAIKKEKRGKIYGYTEYEEFDLESVFFKNLMDRIKKKMFTPKMLQEVCLVAGKQYQSVRTRLNEMLRKEGYQKTLLELVTPKNIIVKKDKLGFAEPDLSPT